MIHNALLVLETQSYRSACNVENKTWMFFFSVEKGQNCAISIFFSISLWWKLHLLCTMIEYKYTSWCICTPIDIVLNRRTRVPTKSSLQHMLGLQTRARNLSKKLLRANWRWKAAKKKIYARACRKQANFCWQFYLRSAVHAVRYETK